MPLIPPSSSPIQLCPSLELRYSTAVVKAPKEKYAAGFYNTAKFYLYSTALKHSIGKPFQLSFKFTKKAAKKAGGEKPTAAQLSSAKITMALGMLLDKNRDMSLAQTKKSAKNEYTITLDDEELLVYWLTHFSSIYDSITSSETEEEVNMKMAKILVDTSIASFNLSCLLSTKQSELETACKQLVSLIKKALKGNPYEQTHGITKIVQLVRYAIKCFLKDHDVNPAQVDEILIRLSRTKAGTVSRVADAMRLKSLPIIRYREIWEKLTKTATEDNTALLLMVFLNLEAEEVCGLQKDDYRPITGYYDAYQIRITHKLIKLAKKRYQLELIDGNKQCRNVPVPRAIQKQLKRLLNENDTESDYLFHVDGVPLDPDEITKKLQELLSSSPLILRVKDQHGREKKVDVSFQASSYRESCRFYWQYHCGLTAGEICYLSALTPPDTAAAHYIDFNNATMQYRMMKQIEYGLALFANEVKKYPSHREWTPIGEQSFWYAGGLNTRAGMDIHITEPVSLVIQSNRGFTVFKEEGGDE